MRLLPKTLLWGLSLLGGLFSADRAVAQSSAPAALPDTATVWTTTDTSRDAFTQIVWPAVPEALKDAVLRGRGLVRQTWVISPSLDPSIAGLGPTYNRPACTTCHPRNGRGQPPASRDAAMHSMLVRLSIPGRDAHGGPLPEPHYGDQLNEFGVPGVPGEGEALLAWREHIEVLPDGTRVALRRPQIRWRGLAYGPMHPQVMTSLRVAPPLMGLGLLEAVPEATLREIAAQQRASRQGVRGELNQVWDATQGKTVVGRFGWKANQPTVRQQIAGALAGDMGITTSLFARPNCPAVQTQCAARKEIHPELDDASLDAMTRYHLALAVPAPRQQPVGDVRQGEQLFARAGCAQCHRPTLETGEQAPWPAMARQIIHPYTDLLLHDMGAALADGRPDFRATGRQWRTPPLWGLGLIGSVNAHTTLLHDGRARNLLEAILWHGGEARRAKAAVRAMSTQEREALLAFLRAL